MSEVSSVLLENAAREILKGTLVPLAVRRGLGIQKFSIVNRMKIRRGEVDRVARVATTDEIAQATLAALRSFEDDTHGPGLSVAARLPEGELATFARLLETVRGRDADPRRRMDSLAAIIPILESRWSPLGMLHLERIEMVPDGIERGELVGTIPLAPGEKTAVTQREWSVTSKEFTTIVTDSLDEVSETGVTDNTDLLQSTTSQNQHSNQFNVTGTVQGGIPLISGSTTTSYGVQEAAARSATDSIRHATAVTRKASSRSRQEHKVTISTKTETGTDTTSTRQLENKTNDPIRVDYFSLMRKWRVRLYRYGLRMTYDMVVPQPGATLRRDYAALDQLRREQGPFLFPYGISDVNEGLVDPQGHSVPAGQPGVPRYRWLADRFAANINPIPLEPPAQQFSLKGAGSGSWLFEQLEFDVPEGARIREIRVSTHIGKHPDGPIRFAVLGSALSPPEEHGPALMLHDVLVPAFNGTPYMEGQNGKQKMTFFLHYSSTLWIGISVSYHRDADVFERWRSETYAAISRAAQEAHYQRQEDIANRIGALEARITNVDTLTLRREESDEVMKSVLKFILGTEFNFMSGVIRSAYQPEQADAAHGIGFDDQQLNLSDEQWALLKKQQELIRFVNQAIEWENVVTFLYSYFWDVPESWNFIRQIRHSDANRQAFLRAGSARVVLTVRKGWETRWLNFVETGEIEADPLGVHLTIAEEIAAYDDRNYPGIPPANPGQTAVHLPELVFATCDDVIEPSHDPVSIEIDSSAGFVVGRSVVIDVADARNIQESAVILNIPDDTHIEVAGVQHAHNGTDSPIPIVQPGEKGALVAEWFEYTPSSGIDIAVTSNLASIA